MHDDLGRMIAMYGCRYSGRVGQDSLLGADDFFSRIVIAAGTPCGRSQKQGSGSNESAFYSGFHIFSLCCIELRMDKLRLGGAMVKKRGCDDFEIATITIVRVRLQRVDEILRGL